MRTIPLKKLNLNPTVPEFFTLGPQNPISHQVRMWKRFHKAPSFLGQAPCGPTALFLVYSYGHSSIPFLSSQVLT